MGSKKGETAHPKKREARIVLKDWARPHGIMKIVHAHIEDK
jgi:hypothetical protein